MDQKSKKILIFATNYLPQVGGAEIALQAVTDQLSEYQFDLITTRVQKSLPERERIGNVEVFRVGSKLALADFIFHKNFFPLAAYRKGKELLSRQQYDLIFVLQASQAGGAVWLLKKTGRIKQPIVLNLQEGRNFERSFNPLRTFFFKRILRSADYVVAISEYLKRIAIRSGVDPKKVQVIPNGVAIEQFSREFSYGELSDLSDKLGIKPDEKVIVSTSRFAPKNGLEDLILAISQLINNWQGLRYKLILPGSGKLEPALRALADKLGISKDVVFPGSISHDELPKYLHIADVFVRPSLSEGLGNSFLEAMACGVPVIGTPVGGIPDFLIEGETGLFCEIGNPASIAEKIKLLLSDSKIYSHIISKAYLLVKEKYNWKTITTQYRQLFQQLTNEQ